MNDIPSARKPARIIIVMGVSSSGKSVVGAALAKRLGAPFLDGDGYHPPANKAKMASGTPLTDADRWPWLETHAKALREAADAGGIAVGASSALKRAYRDFLIEKAGEPILFVHLDGPKEVIAERIARRKHEYMPASLLDSQFATLEEPGPDEDVLIRSILDPIDVIAAKAANEIEKLGALERGN